LCIQGPTDTGIDDPIRIDGGSYRNQTLGLGLTTLQVNVNIPVTDKFSLYGAAGIYRLNDAEKGKEKILAQTSTSRASISLVEGSIWNLALTLLLLERGILIPNGEDDPKSRSVTLIYSRFQLEY
jgi:hypothetical protein